MSAFFLWDTGPVAKAILEEFKKQGRSVDPKDYDLGVDDWGNTVKINMPELVGDEYFTDEWDVNVYEDDGVFSIVAYPVYDGVVECSAWITCLSINQKGDEMSEIDLTIQEVAWAALQDPAIRNQIGDKLDLSEVWLEKVYKVLNEQINPEVTA